MGCISKQSHRKFKAIFVILFLEKFVRNPKESSKYVLFQIGLSYTKINFWWIPYFLPSIFKAFLKLEQYLALLCFCFMLHIDQHFETRSSIFHKYK